MRLLITMLGIMFLAGTASAEGDSVLKTEKDRLSYSIGMDIGNSLKNKSLDIDSDLLFRGINDKLSGNELLLTEQEFRDTMTNLQKEIMAQREIDMKETGDKNTKEGEAFLAENKEKDGVVTLPSGLQYEIIKKGSGDSPTLTDQVTVNYSGTLIDGTEFDSSYRRGKPATFNVNSVIPGWIEAMQLMKTGSTWKIYIPSRLAYGENGAGRQIGPHATLIFRVELLSIN